jgi:hypothetical protein
MDYGEYQELLENTGHVTPVRTPDTGQKPHHTFFYTNARSEIAEAALYIRALHENQGVPFESMAVSIGDTENYEPYVLREFRMRNIPFVRRTGKFLTSYPGGKLFTSIADNCSRDFAFDTLKELLLNSHLPWKNPGDINQLIDFGIRNNCISSWKETDSSWKGTGETGSGEREIHVWQDAFRSPLGSREERARIFYEHLREHINSICRSASFAEIRKQYFAFRETFLDMDSCLPETDLVLSRCVSELMSLIEIEKSFPDIKVPGAYTFFVEYLKEKTYLPQEHTLGVAVLPYRTAAPAPFECHIILGATQDNLSAIFSRLGFLPKAKREGLGLKDDDASEAFINLHSLNSRLPAAFFCAQETFSGYAIPHSRLNVTEKPRMRYGGTAGTAPEGSLPAGAFSPDLFKEEQDFYHSLQAGSPSPDFPRSIHGVQREGFNAWLAGSTRTDTDTNAGRAWTRDPAILNLIRMRYCYDKDFPGKFSVSASSMEPYFNCALLWFFQRVINLENVRIETSLMAENIMGSVFHAALNCFFTAVKEAGGILSPLQGGAITPEYGSMIVESLRMVFDGLPALPPGNRPVMSALTARLIRAEEKTVHSRLVTLLTAFLAYFGGYRVLGSEIPRQSERDSYYLNGTVDCLLEDIRDNSALRGTSVIVDFKLYNLPKRPGCTASGDEGLTNFQLPLYTVLVEEHEGKPVHGALFFSIVKAEPQVIFGVIEDERTGKLSPYRERDRIIRNDDPGIAVPGGNDEADWFRLIMGEFHAKAEQYAGEISRGDFSTISTSFKKCAGCDYNRVCRTTCAVGRDAGLLNPGASHE